MGDVARRTRPTSRDVAALAGVAQSTVSAAMSGNRTVAADTKQRIEEAMVKLGYQPNAGARTLRTSRTNVLALVIEVSRDVDGVDTVPYIDAVIEGARRRDYDVIFSKGSEGPSGLRRLISRSICDGVLLMDIQINDDRIPIAAELGHPAVLVGVPDDAMGFDVVDFNSALAAHLLVDDLAATGHDHVVLVASEEYHHMSKFRAFIGFYEAALERARHHGMQAQLLVPDSLRWRDVNNLAPAIAAASSSKLGMIARTPRATEWCLRLLLQTNLEAGVDVSVSAMCTDDVARSFGIGITNVSPRPREMVDRAVDQLFLRMRGANDPAIHALLAPEGLTRRESTIRFDQR